jgi:signal peptidase II
MSESTRDSADAGVPESDKGEAPSLPMLKAYQSKWAWARFLTPAVLGLAADLWLKAWSFPVGVPESAMAHSGRNPAILQQEWPLIPHVLRFTTTVNQGAVFGIGQGKVGLFLAFSLVALGIIIWVFVTSGAKHRVVHLALGLITAGALGNLYDRAVHHGVRDMLQFYVSWYQYIFNVADVLLCVGVPLLIVRWMFVKDETEKRAG